MTEQEQKLKNYVLYLLSRQEYSRKQLERKLEQKGAEPKFSSQLLDWCESHDFISESRFCESLIRQEINKGHGVQRIKAKGYEKGISAQRIDSTLSTMDIDWFELARSVFVKKYGDQSASDYPTKAKQMRYLAYRGFSPDQIHYAMQPKLDNE